MLPHTLFCLGCCPVVYINLPPQFCSKLLVASNALFRLSVLLKYLYLPHHSFCLDSAIYLYFFPSGCGLESFAFNLSLTILFCLPPSLASTIIKLFSDCSLHLLLLWVALFSANIAICIVWPRPSLGCFVIHNPSFECLC